MFFVEEGIIVDLWRKCNLEKISTMKSKFAGIALIVFTIMLFNGCKKKDLITENADFIGNWGMYYNFCTISIDSGNNLEYKNQTCNSRECWVVLSGNAKIKNDYIYLKNSLNIYQKEFHIDKYPWQETTTIPGGGGYPPTVFQWKMILTGLKKKGSGSYDNLTFYR